MTRRIASRPDPLTPEQRRKTMSRIISKNTAPEMLIRKGLHARGHRFRLHVRALPGTPDIVLPRRRAVVLVHGCFWHGHDCSLSVTPNTNTAAWLAKIEGNVERDRRAIARLRAGGWRVLTVWECALRGQRRWPFDVLMNSVSDWLISEDAEAEFCERDTPTPPA